MESGNENTNANSNTNTNANANYTTTTKTNGFQFDKIKDIPLTTLFRYETPPRDVIQGSTRAIKTIMKGVLTGLTSFFGFPIMLTLTFPKGRISGFVMGVAAGVLSGVGYPLVSALVGLNQILSGILKTPNAMRCRYKGQIYDPDNAEWRYYFLQHELKSMKESISQKRQQKNGSSGSNNNILENDFYELLEVAIDASSSEIKKAYHKKAKKLHPDKNLGSNSEEATDNFNAIHKAYETLSNENSRRVYDQSGGGHIVRDENVDVYRFFPILYGLTPKMQKYVGNLRLVMLLDRMILDQGYKRDLNTTQMYDNMQSLREVDIGIHLQKKITPFFNGIMNREEFIETCRVEAEELCKGEYGGILLKTIGSAIVSQARTFLSSYHIIPMKYASNLTRKKIHSMKDNWGITRKTFGVVKDSVKSTIKTVKLYEQQNNVKFREQMSDNSKREFAKMLGESMEETIPNIFDLSLSIILKDISRTIQNACKKLFVDATIKEEEWKRRASAVQIIGEVFYESGNQKLGDGQNNDSELSDDMIDKIEIAFVVAMKEVSIINIFRLFSFVFSNYSSYSLTTYYEYKGARNKSFERGERYYFIPDEKREKKKKEKKTKVIRIIFSFISICIIMFTTFSNKTK